MNDLDLVRERLQALIGNQRPSRIVTLVHEGVPVPKGRARAFAMTRDDGSLGIGQYTPARTREAQQSLAWAFKAALNRGPLFDDRVAIVAIFFRPDRRALDVDNLMKLVMDAATKARVWKDDSQVVAQAVLLELDRERPRTVVAICPYLSAHSRAPLLTETEAIQ